jgi:tetratricopeptide (TPR) repeat protein
VHRFGGGYWSAFSPDSRLLAVNDVFGALRLLEVPTAREVARLTAPEPAWYQPHAFTPDGTRLIAVNIRMTEFYVWDLRLIRQQLKDLGMDWEWPAFPPAAPGGPAPRVEVLPRDGDPSALTPEQKARQAIDRYARAVAANPDSAEACNNLAWVYLTAPEGLRDVKAALPLAQKAARLKPGHPVCVNTLGVAYYRDGRYREAVDTLRPNLERQTDADLAHDLFFLAMAHHRLGEAARARDYYEWAARWTAAHRDLSANAAEERRLFRAEAAELLGLNPKQD